MKRRIICSFRQYNANTKDVRKGDCSVRALSLAYGIDYELVYKSLKTYQKELGYSIYNDLRNIEYFIEGNNSQKIQVDKSIDTVDDFCNFYTIGTYLLLTSKTDKSHINHIVAVIDGDLYDTWDSLNQHVREVYCVSSDTTHMYSDEFNINDAALQIWEPLDNYIQSQNKKVEFMYVDLQKLEVKGNDTVVIVLKCILDDSIPIYSKYKKSSVITQRFIAKFNLKKDQTQNVKVLIPKLRTKIYDWMYNIRKDIQDAKKAETINRKDFLGDKTLVAKLPEWSHPYVTYASTLNYSSAYSVDMDALDGDPRKSELPTVYFRADSLRELKQQLASYKANFSRLGYDY